MKRANVITAVTVVLQLVLIASPFYLSYERVIDLSKPTEFYALFTALVGVDFALLTALMSYLSIEENEKLNQQIVTLTERAGTTVKALRDEAFYRHFLEAAKDARHTVRIAYFSPTPPDSVDIPDREKYYQEMTDLMWRRGDVRFKRLVRYSDENRAWIERLVRKFAGRHNIDIAVLSRDLPADERMPLAMSVQVVDDEKTYLVAIASHEREGEYRDVFIENPVIAKAMETYYQRLWHVSEELLAAGQLTPDGKHFLQPPTAQS